MKNRLEILDSDKINTQPLIKVGGRKSFCPSEIAFLEGDKNYTTIHLFSGKTVLVATTLKILEERLNASGYFFRINKSYLVNWDFVLNVSDWKVELVNNQVIFFSRRRKQLFTLEIKS